MVTDKQITKFRKRYDVSREWLANEVGVGAQTVWRWEKGAVIPKPAMQVLERIIANGRPTIGVRD